MSIPEHNISVVTDGKEIPGWFSYEISCDVLQPADAFSMEVQFTRDAWALLKVDAEVTVYIDQTKILTGYIGTRSKRRSRGEGTVISITGRDKTGRLVDESSPLFRYGGLKLKELAEKICGIGTTSPLFERVVLVNTRNRSLLRSVKARQAKTIREPIDPVTQEIAQLQSIAVRENEVNTPISELQSASKTFGKNVPKFRSFKNIKVPQPPIIDPGIFTGRAIKKKVAPGMSRWQVLEEFLREARLIAWSTADGRELFVGYPNYDQEVQYLFREREVPSPETNAMISVTENIEEMYSAITCVGASKGSGPNYGRSVTKNRSTVFDDPDGPAGVGINFRRRKWLLITDDSIKSQRQALERAEREKLEREVNFLEVGVQVAGHSQFYSGRKNPVIYAVDTMARVVDEATGLNEAMYITSVSYSKSRQGGTTTTLSLVPKGTMLQL